MQTAMQKMIEYLHENKYFDAIPVAKELLEDEKETYWKTRCELAEHYIKLTPCDPDIYPDQLEAYRKWKDAITKITNI